MFCTAHRSQTVYRGVDPEGPSVGAPATAPAFATGLAEVPGSA